MSYAFPPDIARMIEAQMQTGQYASEDDVLRVALESHFLEETDDLETIDDSIAIQDALDDLAKGDRGRPAKEVFDEIRREFGFPERP